MRPGFFDVFGCFVLMELEDLMRLGRCHELSPGGGPPLFCKKEVNNGQGRPAVQVDHPQYHCAVVGYIVRACCTNTLFFFWPANSDQLRGDPPKWWFSFGYHLKNRGTKSGLPGFACDLSRSRTSAKGAGPRPRGSRLWRGGHAMFRGQGVWRTEASI